jgi:glycosyltransferase involved in cell wall biosynthesis
MSNPLTPQADVATGQRPSVTVLMSVFNGQEFLRKAVDSILAQTYKDFELLVIDDCSSDRSADILRSYTDRRLRVVRNPQNLGLTAALNLGLQLSRGELIARQDADDVSHATRLEGQVGFLRQNPHIALLGTQVRIINEMGRVLRPMVLHRCASERGVDWQLLFGNPFVHSSVMFRRAVIADLGGYNESLRYSQDIELWSRVLTKHQGTNLTETLVDYRTHPGSLVNQRGSEVLESRRHNLRLNQELLSANTLRLTGDSELATSWANLWVEINVPWITGDPPAPARALTLIKNLYNRFISKNPAARDDAEIHLHLASVYLYLAYYLAARDRPAAVVSLGRSLYLRPRVTPRHLASIGVGLVFGNAGIRRLRGFVAALRPRPAR